MEMLEKKLKEIQVEVDCERRLAIACDLKAQAMEERLRASECGGMSEIEKLFWRGMINGIAIPIVGQTIV